MRYGGYVLIALPLIIYTSFMLDKLNIERKKLNFNFDFLNYFCFRLFRQKYNKIEQRNRGI